MSQLRVIGVLGLMSTPICQWKCLLITFFTLFTRILQLSDTLADGYEWNPMGRLPASDTLVDLALIMVSGPVCVLIEILASGLALIPRTVWLVVLSVADEKVISEHLCPAQCPHIQWLCQTGDVHSLKKQEMTPRDIPGLTRDFRCEAPHQSEYATRINCLTPIENTLPSETTSQCNSHG